MFLNENFIFSRPLSVTGAYFIPARTIDGVFYNEEVFFHQMTLDRIENGEYILQNSEISFDAPGLVYIFFIWRYFLINENNLGATNL